MDLKNFLSPTGPKLVLAALLFFLFVPIVEFGTGIVCITAPCGTEATSSVAGYLYESHFSYPHTKILLFDLPLALAGLLLSYLAGCLVVFLAPRKH